MASTTKTRVSDTVINVLPTGTTQLSSMTFSTVGKRRDICLEYERIQEENFAANNNGGVYTNMFNIGSGTIANSNGRLSYTGGTAAAWRMLGPIKSPYMTVSADVENPTGVATTNAIVGVGVTYSTGNNDKYWVEYNAVNKAFKIRKTINNVTTDLVSVTLNSAPTRIFAVWTGKFLSSWTVGVDGNPNPVCHGVTPTNSDFDLRTYANYSTLFPYLVLQCDSGTSVRVSRWCHSHYGTIGYFNPTAVRYIDGTPMRIGDEFIFTATSSGLSSNPGTNEWVHFHSVILAINHKTHEVRQIGTLLQQDTSQGKIYGQHVYCLRFDPVTAEWWATHSTYGSSDDVSAVRVKYNRIKGDILHGVHILPNATAVGLTVSGVANDLLFYDFDFVKIDGTLRCCYARGNNSSPSGNTVWNISFGSGLDLDTITQDSQYTSFNAEGPKISRIGGTWCVTSKVMTTGGTVANNSYVYWNLETGAYVGTFAADIAEGTSLKTHTPIVEIQNGDGTTGYMLVTSAPDDGFQTSAGTAINWTQGSTQIQKTTTTNAGWAFKQRRYPYSILTPKTPNNRDFPRVTPIVDPLSTVVAKVFAPAGGTITASTPLFNGTQTWNASGTTFSAFTINVTNTASASGSLLLDLQIGGTSIVKIDKAAGISLWESGTTYDTIAPSASGGVTFSRSGTTGSWIYPGDGRYVMINSGYVGWSSGTNPVSGLDTAMVRGKAAVVSIEGASSVGGTHRFTPLTPSQITADQNNYAPSGSSKYLRLSTDASRTITGLSISQVTGEEHVIINVGSQSIVLANESASSTAANRFTNSTGADVTLSANQMADLVYDGTTSRWRVTKRN